MRFALIKPLRAMVAYRELLYRLVRRDIVNRTSGTILGGIWLMAQPALQVVAFWFLLDVVLKIRNPGRVAFIDYFLTAMLAWLLVNEVFSRSLNVLSEFSGLYQKTLFPIKVLPLIPVAMAVIIYAPVYMIVAGVIAGGIGVLKAGLIIGFLVIWVIPFAYLLAIIGLFFRESRQLIPFMLTLLMYFSPILYQPEALPENLRVWMAWNPLAGLLAIIQHLVHDLPLTLADVLVPWLLWALLLIPAGWLFHRAEPHMREEL